MMLCSLIFLFLGCRRTEIVWNDMRSNKDADFSVHLSFYDERNERIDRKIKDGAKSCKFIPCGYNISSSECDSCITVAYYLTKDHKQIEFFVLDSNPSRKLSYNEELAKVDGAFAYFIDLYDNELERYCRMFSKDNIFTIKKDELRIDETLPDSKFLNLVEKNDVGYYSPILTEDDKKRILLEDSFGCYVESKISDYIFQIWTTNAGISDIFFGFRKSQEGNDYEVEYVR